MRRTTGKCFMMLLLILAVAVIYMPRPAFAAADGDNWSWLQEQINNADPGDVIELPDDVINLNKGDRIQVKKGKDVTIDLKGHTLDRNRTSNDSDGHVIEVFEGSTLTIKDSSTEKTGTITGGYANRGGGINIHENAVCVIEGGTITGNNADVDGGGIYVKGQLTMTGGSVTGNFADDTGGGVFVASEGQIDLTGADISENKASNEGGGLKIHLKADSSINNCNITNNESGSYGGGLHFDSKAKTLQITDTSIDGNISHDDGAGIYLRYGTINMTGGSLSGNTTDNDGGGAKITKETTFTADGVTISGNQAKTEEGGGVKNLGTTTLTNCAIAENSAKKQGGGVFNDDTDGAEGDLTIDSCTISNNRTQSNGGGIYSDEKLAIKGDTVIGSSEIGRGNYAADRGCGVFIGSDSEPTHIEGKLVVQDNLQSARGQNVYLRTGQKLTLSGALIEGTKIGVTMNDGLGTFTADYSKYNSVEQLASFFFSPESLGVEMTEDKKEGQLTSSWPDLQTKINETPDKGTIELDHDYTAVSGSDRLQIKDKKSITIDLMGHTLNRNLTSEEKNGHVLEVFEGAKLTIKDSSDKKTGTITGGYSTRGGGIYVNKGAVLEMEAGTISQNSADEDGGGIYVAGDLTVTGGAINNNDADTDGGGIFVTTDGTISLKDAVIDSNSASKRGGGLFLHLKENATVSGCQITNNRSSSYGGGLFMDAKGKTLAINNSTDKNTQIEHNNASDDGAGIYLRYGTIDMTGGSLSGNTTDNDGGGAKITKDTTFTANGVTISNNQAKSEEGGGVKNLGTTTLKNCIITGNSAKKHGGGVFNDDDDSSEGDLTVDGCTISGNSSSSNGGGVYSDHKLTLKGNNTIGESEVEGTAYEGNSAAERGGGLFVGRDSKSADISNSLVMKGNKAVIGKDIYLRDGQKLNLTGEITGTNIGSIDMQELGIFTVNYSTYHSGVDPKTYFNTDDSAMHVELTEDGKEAQISSSWPDLQTLINETEEGKTLTLDKGYIADYNDSRLEIKKDITIDLNGFTLNRSCIHERDNGHVIEVYKDAMLTIKDSSDKKTGTITGGYAQDGGGIYVSKGATLKMEAGTISGNKADGDGGGIFVAGTLIMENAVITDNYADDTGGGIYVTSNGTIDLDHVKITNNTADTKGGGINLHMGEDSSIESCTISDNIVNGDVGGGIRMEAGSRKLTIEDTHIDNNYSKDDGAGIYLEKGTIEMTGGMISGNTSVHDGGGVKVVDGTTFTADGVTISKNSASVEEGGGVKNLGTTTLKNCIITENSAKKQGGGIFNDDTDGAEADLTIENCTIAGNNATDHGGGIYSDHKLTLKGSNTIGAAKVGETSYAGNRSKERGGGIFIGKDSKFFKLEGTLTVKDNTADDYGNDLFLNGSKKIKITGELKGEKTIRVDMANGTGTLTEDYSDHNTAEPSTFFVPTAGYSVELKDGEAVIGSNWSDLVDLIKNHEGEDPLVLTQDYAAAPKDDRLQIKKNITIDLNGHTINRNRQDSDGDGHVFEVFEGYTLTIKDSSEKKAGAIMGGWATRGGGINVHEKAELKLESGTISGNKASEDGGGVYVRGSLIMTGGTITGNTAEEDGGGICLIDGSTFTLSGGAVTENTADDEGGGIFVDSDVTAVKVSGSPSVNKNKGIKGYDLYLESDLKKLTVTGPFEDSANLGVSANSDYAEVAVTSGYSKYNAGKDPSKYFTSSDGYEVFLKNSEVAFTIPIEDGTQFIPKTSQIQTDLDQLCPQNWMAGISGERWLNEINLPGTHDSGMKALWHWTSSQGYIDNFGGSKYAYTQRRYIDEQMEDGIRKFDVRLTNEKLNFTPSHTIVNISDDSNNLYLCHGKDQWAGTYYAKDHDGEQLSLRAVLDYSKDFLQKHPTEVIILGFSPEVTKDNDDDTKSVEKVLTKILREFSREINPSTGKPYMYLEDGVFGKQMTNYPKLKDVRGQVITNYEGGFSWKMANNVTEYSPEGETKESASSRIKRVLDFYTEHPPLDLPKDAKTHFDFIYHAKTNSTNQLADTPLELVDKIHPVLYGPGNIFGPRNTGKYIGYINMDGENATDARYVWETNFFDGLEYCKVDVKSGLDNTDLWPDQTYQLLRHTSITVPKNIYKVDQKQLGKYFAGWRDSGGDLWLPGQTVELTDDITFTAEWSSEATTPIQVIWKDGDDKDELRPETLNFSINGTTNFKVTAENGWTGLYTGEITNIVPTWNRIETASDPKGEDTTGQYRYEVSGDADTGYIFTLYHTPQEKISVSGTVEWDDANDLDGMRPDSVTLHLWAGEKEIGSTTVGAADDWQYSFADQPKYENGERIEYTITEDTITGYDISIDGFAVTNSRSSEESSTQLVFAGIQWNDDNNDTKTRPRSVTLNLQADGKVIDTQTVTEDEFGAWTISFDVTAVVGNNPDVVFDVTAEPVDGYSYKTELTGDGFIVTMTATNNLNVANINLSETAFTYNGKAQRPQIRAINGLTLIEGTDYTAEWSDPDSTNAGTYTVRVIGKGSYKGTAEATYTIDKAANPLKVKGKKVKVKAKKLKKKTQTLKVSKAIKFKKKGQGKLSYKLVSVKKGKKNFKNKIRINKKTGKIKVKKGLKKGTYKVIVKVKAKGTANYKASAWKKVTFKVKVK